LEALTLPSPGISHRCVSGSPGGWSLRSRRADVDDALREGDLDPLLLKAGEEPFAQLMLHQVLVHKLMHLDDQGEI
jgi:hypothetical protein